MTFWRVLLCMGYNILCTKTNLLSPLPMIFLKYPNYFHQYMREFTYENTAGIRGISWKGACGLMSCVIGAFLQGWTMEETKAVPLYTRLQTQGFLPQHTACSSLSFSASLTLSSPSLASHFSCMLLNAQEPTIPRDHTQCFSTYIFLVRASPAHK